MQLRLLFSLGNIVLKRENQKPSRERRVQKKSPALLSFSEKVLKGGESSIMSRGGRQPLLDTFRNKHLTQTPAQFLEYIVDLLGFLHHHSIQNKQIWNPVVEYEYELDALLLGDLYFEICSTKVESLICVPLNVNQK